MHIRASCSGEENDFLEKPDLALTRLNQKSQKSNNHKTHEKIMISIGKLTHFVSASVGIDRHILYPTDCLLDTGAQRSLIAKVFLPDHWTAHRKAAGNVHLHSDSKDIIDFIGKINLHVHIGDSSMQPAFCIVDRLAVDILSESSFIEENNPGI